VSELPAVTEEEFRKVSDFLYRRTGMLFTETKHYYMQRRVADRMAFLKIASFATYFAYLRGDVDREIEKFINAFTVNETYFYREEHQLRCLSTDLLNERVRPCTRCGELAATRGSVMDHIAERLFGPVAGDVMAVLAIVSIAASVSAMTIAGPRVYFAMARDRVFFNRAAIIHPVYGTPAAAIVAQALWSAVLVLTGSFNSLFTYTGFAVVLFSGIAGIALFVLRWRRPDETSPFRTWGYPVMPGLFVIASAAIVLNALVRDPVPTAAGLAIILGGLPLYVVFRHNSRKMGSG